MGESIEFTCECGTEDAIARQSVDMIASATGWDREDCLLCDHCLSEALEGVTLDLSIGGGHTRSEEFKQQREERKRQRNADEIAAVQDASVVTFTERFVDDDRDVERVAVDMPSEAKHDLKQLQTSIAHPEYDRGRQAWAVDATALEDAVDLLREQGWTVDVDVDVGTE